MKPNDGLKEFTDVWSMSLPLTLALNRGHVSWHYCFYDNTIIEVGDLGLVSV